MKTYEPLSIRIQNFEAQDIITLSAPAPTEAVVNCRCTPGALECYTTCYAEEHNCVNHH